MRVEMMGTPVDLLTENETLSLIENAMSSKTRLQHVALNVAKFVSLQSNSELKRDVMSSDIVGIDGMGIVLAMKALGHSRAKRFAGVDVMEKTLKICADKGFKPFFLGATPGVVEAACNSARLKFPELVFAGSHHGYFNSEDEERILNLIQVSGADCLFIGMPTPRKERLLFAWKDKLEVSFIMGVGGGLDVLAGKVKRAPEWMQANGLEWLYRIYQEPGRMWWRYLSTNILFAGYFLRVLVARILKPPYKA